jgi:polyisoprenoid-binding protein YceI
MTVTIPPPGEYRIDPGRSTVRFKTRHFFGLGGVRGVFSLRDGTIRVADPVTGSHAEAGIDAGSFHTGTTARDKVVRSAQYLDTQNHPVIAFHAGSLREENGKWLLDGELTVRGTTGPLGLEIGRTGTDGSALVATASTRVDRYQFGVTAGKGITGRYLDLEVEIVADPA